MRGDDGKTHLTNTLTLIPNIRYWSKGPGCGGLRKGIVPRMVVQAGLISSARCIWRCQAVVILSHRILDGYQGGYVHVPER